MSMLRCTWLTFGQAPITAWAADKKNQEIGAYNHLSLEQDMEGEFRRTFWRGPPYALD
jgi:hypothetical protein